MRKNIALAALCAATLVVAACGKKPAPPPAETTAPPPVTIPAPVPEPAGVTVSSITLGNEVGTDKKVTRSLDALGTNDTIFASVDTAGSGAATLKARWTYVQGGESVPVHEETLPIDATGPATTEFHISKPDGWPTGEYLVEVFVDDSKAAEKRFTVN